MAVDSPVIRSAADANAMLAESAAEIAAFSASLAFGGQKRKLAATPTQAPTNSFVRRATINPSAGWMKSDISMNIGVRKTTNRP